MKRTKQEEKAVEKAAAPAANAAVTETVNPEEPQKKRRGRPKKEVPADADLVPAGPLPGKKRPGRPKKAAADAAVAEKPAKAEKKRPGRPKKAAAKVEAPAAEIPAEIPAAPVEEKAADSVVPAPEAVLEPSETSVYIQSVLGGTIAIDEIIARVHSLAPDAREIYIKPEENKAYWVGKESQGYVILWD